MTLQIMKVMGTCEDCRSPLFDIDGCTRNRIAVAAGRTANPCGCTCKEMNFASCALKTPFSDCLCQDGVTTADGYKIAGGYIGWGAPVGKTFEQIAAITSPDNPHAYYQLFGSNALTNLVCPSGPEDWDALQMDGEYVRTDLGAMPLSIDPITGDCISGAYPLTNEQLLIEDDSAIPPTGTNCLQTGGRAALAMQVLDGNGKQLAFCVFGGIIPPPRCDRQQCCSWSITNTHSSSDGTTATIDIDLALPADCVCTPTGTVTFSSVGRPDQVFPLSTSPTTVGVAFNPYTPGEVVTVTLSQVYEAPGCEACSAEPTVNEFTLT